MSGNGVSAAETAEPDQYFPAAHQHFNHYKQQQQQQCVRHLPLHQQQQYLQNNSSNSNNIWLPPYNNTTATTTTTTEFDEHYRWQNHSQHQQQQQHQQNTYNHIGSNSNSNFDSHRISLSGSAGICGVEKTYVTPLDIPTPPPHPPNYGGSKRFPAITRNRGTRCQCDHAIEVLQHPQPQQQKQHQQLQPILQHSTHNNNTSSTNAYLPHARLCAVAQQQQQQQQQQQHQQQPRSLHNCPRDYLATPLTPREHVAANCTRYHKNYHRNLEQPPTSPPGKALSSARQLKTLVYSQMKIRRVRIILGVVFTLVVIALVATALYFVIKSGGEDEAPKTDTGNAIQLQDVLSGHLAAKRFNASWSIGPNVIYKDNNFIVEYNVKDKKRIELLREPFPGYVSFEKSADGALLLLGKNYRKNFRHSFLADFDIYNISSKQTHPLTIKNEQRPLIMAQWAPTGNGLIINFERNLYYKPNAFATEVAITDDENPGILNGVPDWVYEEEVFSSNSATWFNPSGTKIAFIKFDDSSTHVINFPYYGEAGDLNFQYPLNRLIAYPKTGSSNPRVSLFTADLERAAKGLEFITAVPVPSALNTETDYIITEVTWLDDQNMLSVWMNRTQNIAHLQVFDAQKVRRQEIFKIESKTGWVDLFHTPLKNRNGKRIALILPQTQGEYGDFRHVCTLSTINPNASPEALTKGKYVVQDLLHWDSSSDIIFYTANTEQHSEILHIYAIKATTGQVPQCLTCELHTSGAVKQTYYSATFSSDHLVVISSLGEGIPIHSVYEWSYGDAKVSLTKLLDWESNDVLRDRLKNTAMPTHEIHTLRMANGFDAKVLLQLPPNFDRSGKTKYPMLVDVYGGPDSFSVVNKWAIDWGTYLSSNHSIIYAKIDGRGSGLRGDKLLHSVYLKFGTVEIADQINVTKQLQEKFKYIDAAHTGIWGWSYGGYAAALALANDDTHVFKCAASVAPVTDWAYYDTIYTERYMSLPSLNERGYADSRLSTRAHKFRGKKFLLIHGTLDDNVHYQQAMILAKNLERDDILFKQISYADEDHGLAGVRPHLYHSLDRFFGECFAKKSMIGST